MKRSLKGPPEREKREPTGDPQLGAAIKKARRAKGWNQEVLADAVGVSVGTVSQWETGKIGIENNKRPKVALELAMPFELFFPAMKGAVATTRKEALLLERFDKASPETQQGILLILGISQDDLL
jgi:transcriptional regulator with XRE-family HTH domain